MKRLLSAMLLCILTPLATQANDFPTQARVEFVLGCMNSLGGQTYDAMYRCICRIDKIANELTYQQYEEAEVFSQLWSTAGERGGVFRDPERAREAVTKLKKVVEAAERSCFVRPSPKGQVEVQTQE